MKITEEKFKSAVKDSGGIITLIAQRLGVTRKALYEYIEKKEFQSLINDEKESILDLAESKLLNKLNKDVDWAIKFILTTRGKHRGYIENITNEINFLKQEVNNAPQYKIEIIKPNDNTLEVVPEQEAADSV